MKNTVQEMMTDLVNQGYAVVVFSPDELKGFDPCTLENLMIEFANVCIKLRESVV